MNHTFVAQHSGTRNGHPKYSLREAGDADVIYYDPNYDNGKWIIAGDHDLVGGISDTSPKCPEMVESWQLMLPPLVGGKIRCAKEDQALERCLQNTNDCDNVQL